VNLEKSFTYVFEDEDWLTKVLLGGLFCLLSIILVGIPFVVGYMLTVVRNVATEQPNPLPSWGGDMAILFKRGLVGVAGILVWALPTILISCVLSGLSVATGRSPGAYSPYSASSSTMMTLAIVQMCLGCLSGLYGLVLGVLMPAAMIRFAMTDKLSSFFALRENLSFIKLNLSNYIVAILLSWVASLAAVLGLVACCVGFLFTGFWAYLVTAHLYGQVYRAQPVIPQAT
jgi:hypothetical protein